MSVVVRWTVLVIGLILTVSIFQRSKITASINSVFKDLTYNSEKHYFTNDKVYFALKLKGPNSDKLLDPTYFNFELRQAHYELSSNDNGFTYTFTPIEYEFWGDKFPNVDRSLYDRIGLQTYICPKNTDFFVSGNFNSLNYEAIQVSLSKWTGSNWKSDDEIDKALLNSYIDFQVLSTYFDFTDFVNPVKPYLQDSSYVPIIKNMKTFVNYNVQINEVYDNSNVIFGSQAFGSKFNFYSAEKSDTILDTFSQNDHEYININFALHRKVNQYFRSSYSFWDMLGYIGGIYGLIKSLGYFTFTFLIKREFYSSILSELYHDEIKLNEVKINNNKDLFKKSVKMNAQIKIIPKGI